MSISTAENIKSRILSATPRSKIAVFRCQRGSTVELDAVFDDTVITKSRISSGDIAYVGSYYGQDGRLDFAKYLRESF